MTNGSNYFRRQNAKGLTYLEIFAKSLLLVTVLFRANKLVLVRFCPTDDKVHSNNNAGKRWMTAI